MWLRDFVFRLINTTNPPSNAQYNLNLKFRKNNVIKMEYLVLVTAWYVVII